MGVRKGCFQCSKRRVRCDMGEPRCEKCINRGLPCSGNGIRYRFTNSVASRGKLTGSSMPVAMPAAKRRATQDINPLLVVSKSQAMEETDQVSNARNEANYAIRPYLNQLDGPTRLLFNYCTFRSNFFSPYKTLIEFLPGSFDAHLPGYGDSRWRLQWLPKSDLAPRCAGWTCAAGSS